MTGKESKSARKARKKEKKELELADGHGSMPESARLKTPSAAERRDPPWPGVVLVCRKCGKRNAERTDGIASADVRKALKQELGGGKRRPRVLETGCQSVCPKGIYVSLVGPGALEGGVVKKLEQVPGLAHRFRDALREGRGSRGAAATAAVPSGAGGSVVRVPSAIPTGPAGRGATDEGRKST